MKVGHRKVGLIPEWKKSWRFSSVNITIGLTVLANAYDYIPVLKENFPPDWLKYILPAIVVARIIKVSKQTEEVRNDSEKTE